MINSSRFSTAALAGGRVYRAAHRVFRRSLSMVFLPLLFLGGCGESGDVLIVYSPHGPAMLSAFEERFEALHPGVDVQWIDMGSQEVLERLRSERANPQADVWFGAPSQMFQSAADDGLLEEFEPTWAAAAREYSDPGNRYFGIYLTPEVIAFNSDVVDSASVPRDWEEVLDARWRGQVLIRDPMASGTMRTIFGMFIQRSIRETGSPDAGFEWLRRLDAQTKEYVLNPTLLYQKLARREGLITLWTMPDIEMLKARIGYPIDYVFPTSGTPVVVDAIALVRGGRNPEAARAFIEFVGNEENVLYAAREHFRLPARSDIPDDSLPPLLLRAKDRIVEEPMDWNLLQRQGSAWMRHWDEHVRGEG
jgi:iron(III) transport system substrate-binding protein